HCVARVCQRDDLGDIGYLAVVKPIRIAASVEPLVMVLRGQRHIGKWVMDRLQDLTTHARVVIQLGCLLGIDTIRSVNDLSLDSKLAHVVKVAGHGGSLGLVSSPTDL